MNTASGLLGVVRASSWPSLFDCSYRWYWQTVVGLSMPSSGNAALGTAIHAGTALYDASRLSGQPVPIEAAIDASLGKLARPEEDVRWDKTLTQVQATNFAVCLTARYCKEISPTRQYVAVELNCDALDILTQYGTLRITGTTDRVRALSDGRRGISDLKSGKRATRKNRDGTRAAVTKGHHLQLGIYTLMAEQGTGNQMTAPAEVIGLHIGKDTPVATGEIEDVKTPLLGTEDTPGLITIAAKMLRDGLFPPNPKSMLCSNKYCPAYGTRCHYHE